MAWLHDLARANPEYVTSLYHDLSYDHRLVDGEQAVRFFARVKEQLEDPARMLL